MPVNHGGHTGRAFPADRSPLPSRTVRIGNGLLVPSGGTWNTTATSKADPMRTRLANPKGFKALVTTSFVVEYRRHGGAEPTTQPLSTITAGGNHTTA